MGIDAKTRNIIALISLIAFILIFLIIFRDASELVSSLFAAFIGSLLVLGTLIVFAWLRKVFTK